MPKMTQKQGGEGIWAVTLAFQILESLARSDKPCRVTDLATELGTSKPRIFRHLHTLKMLGYVEQESETERYYVGVRLAMLGNRAAYRFELVNIGRPILQELRDELNLTVVISKIEDNKVLIADKLDGDSGVSFIAKIGSTLDLHSTAQGKLVLAYAEPPILDEVIAQGLQAKTIHTITDPKKLRAEIVRIRQQGWASAPNEMLTGLNAIAVPIFDAEERLRATVAILGSIDSIAGAPKPHEYSLLVRAAEEIARLLYGRRPGDKAA